MTWGGVRRWSLIGLVALACGGDDDCPVDGGVDSFVDASDPPDEGPRDGGILPDAPPIECDPDPAVQFVEVGSAAGLSGVLAREMGECDDALVGGGALVLDIDGDGLDDLFYPQPQGRDRLFRNRGDGTFEDVAPELGLDHDGPSAAAVFFDLEGDGDSDLYVTMGGRASNRLYVRGPDGFTEEAAAWGLDLPPFSPFLCSYQLGVAAGDADGDGDLDLMIASWEPFEGPASDRTRLMINQGGVFTDGTEAAGIDPNGRAGFSPAFADVNGDGVMDIAIAADWGRSRLYLGNGDGTFRDVTETAGVGTDENGMGSVLEDLDQDGDLDWFVTSIFNDVSCDELIGECTGNRLYLGEGDGTFVDGTDAFGVRDGGWGWGAIAIDFDHDGDLDLLHENGQGLVGAYWDDPLRLFRNDGEMRFREIACAYGLAFPGADKGLVPFDLEGDGDLDLFVARSFADPLLFRNDGADTRAWLRVRLQQSGANPSGVGATITIDAGGSLQTRRIHLNPGYGSPAAPEAHFGLGDHEGPVDVQVRWPDGSEQTVVDVGVRQRLLIER